jgi:hypothetical protein
VIPPTADHQRVEGEEEQHKDEKTLHGKSVGEEIMSKRLAGPQFSESGLAC